MFKFGNANSVLLLDKATTLVAAVDGIGGDEGIINVAENSGVQGTIGTTNAIALIDFITNDGKTFTVDGAAAVGQITATTGIRFTKDSTLLVKGTGQNQTIDSAIIFVANNDVKGTIKLDTAIGTNKDVVFTKVIGDPGANNKALKLLEIGAGVGSTAAGVNFVRFDENVNIAKIKFNGASNLKFSKAAGEYKIGNIELDQNDAVTLIVDAAVTKFIGQTAGAAVNFGKTDGNKLKAISFTGNHALEIGDGINFSAVGGFKNNALTDGTLTFLGTSVVDAVVGSNNKFGSININGGAGKIVDFKQDVNLTNDVIIANNGHAIFRAKTEVRDIKGAAVNQGKASFINAAATETSATIGFANGVGAQALAIVEIGGADIKFKNAAFHTQKIEFTNTTIAEGKTTATFEAVIADNFENTIITTTSTTRGHNIVLPTIVAGLNHKFSSAVGTAANRLGYFTIGDKDRVEINTDFYAGVKTTTDGKGGVVFTKNNAISLDLGEKGKEVLAVQFTESGTVKGNVYSRGIVVSAGKTASFEGVVSSTTTGIVLNNAAKASFADGASLDAVINAVNAGNGAVEFNGSTSITKEIGNTAAVRTIDFKGAGIATIAADLKSGNITFANGVVATAGKKFKLSGATELSSIDLVNKEVTFDSGASKFSGQANVMLTLDADASTIGKIKVDGAGSSLDLNNATAFEITVYDNSILGENDRQFELFKATNGATMTQIAADKVKVNNGTGNRFAQWTYANNFLNQHDNTIGVIRDLVTPMNDPVLLEDALNLANPKNTGDAKLFIQDIARFDNTPAGNAKMLSAITRLTKPIETNTAIIAGVVDASKQDTKNRLGLLSPTPGMQTTDLGTTGVAAGDDASKYGAWISPFYSQSTQKERKGSAGYKANSYGATIGFDTMANADVAIGVAVSYAKTDIKHKNFKSGDKTKADTYVFSIYGIQQLTNEWFLQAVASFSTSKVKNTEARLRAASQEKATGKFDTTTYGGDLMVGYNYKVADMGTVTPLVGVNFTSINDGSYKETGTTFQNLNITKKATNKFEGVFGLRAQMNTSNVNGIELTPEAHAFVKHAFAGKNPTITAKLDGMVNPIKPKSAKMDKTTYNLGLGLNARSGMYEYGAGYDLNIANKYLAHQGTLKVRINF